MKSFLLKNGSPIVKWGSLPQGTYFEGTLPEGYALAISPSKGIVILDVDCKNTKNGFDHIPKDILEELDTTFNYHTSNGKGKHYWIRYTGNKTLLNRATSMGLDLRISEKGYVKYHHNVDIRKCVHLIKESSSNLTTWIEKLFS